MYEIKFYRHAKAYRILMTVMHNNNRDIVSSEAPPQSSISCSRGCSVKQLFSLRLFNAFSGIL